MKCHFYYTRDCPLSKGVIVGLCRICTKELIRSAERRGYPILTGPDDVPSLMSRERVVDGVNLFWWRGRWRVNNAPHTENLGRAV